jgi:hypothetical protein
MVREKVCYLVFLNRVGESQKHMTVWKTRLPEQAFNKGGSQSQEDSPNQSQMVVTARLNEFCRQEKLK